jgi:DNA-binding HxlR family transcriptional regulator
VDKVVLAVCKRKYGLCRELKELQQRGLIARKQYDGSPLRVEYSLTESGRGLQPALDSIVEWGLTGGARGNTRDYAPLPLTSGTR